MLHVFKILIPLWIMRLLEKEITNPKCQSTLYLLTLFLIIILQTGKGFDKKEIPNDTTDKSRADVMILRMRLNARSVMASATNQWYPSLFSCNRRVNGSRISNLLAGEPWLSFCISFLLLFSSLKSQDASFGSGNHPSLNL